MSDLKLVLHVSEADRWHAVLSNLVNLTALEDRPEVRVVGNGSLATLIGTPVGVLAGVYLAEYGRSTWLGRITRFVSDILLSAPSIVIGLFIYTVWVARFKSFSGFAGVLALAEAQRGGFAYIKP